MAMLLAYGCSREPRRQPPADAGDSASRAASARVRDAAATRAGNALNSEFWVHGPYGAKECGSCHDPEEPTALVAPLKELCVGCHSVHSRAAVQARGLQIHTPAGEGRCLSCHHPHLASRRYMLFGPDTQALCAHCHDRAALLKNRAHLREDGKDCLACHNPHVGKTRALLRSDFDESVRLYGGK
jgi:predicted CXXCH cytochrome family protein